jgi:rRNA maturation endonuclease Nob1
MAFKDNLSKAAKVVSDNAINVVKKSGDMVEITKTNISIQAQEEKISSLYSEIGIIIYKKYHIEEKIDEDLIPICEKIKTLEEKINELRKKIFDIKKIKVCTSCKNELELEATFCPKCGSKQT